MYIVICYFLFVRENGIGYQIKTIRDKNRLSQERFGKKIGLSGKSISAYETNKITPPYKILEKISRTYNVTIFDLPPAQKDAMYCKITKIIDHMNELKNTIDSGIFT